MQPVEPELNRKISVTFQRKGKPDIDWNNWTPVCKEAGRLHYGKMGPLSLCRTMPDGNGQMEICPEEEGLVNNRTTYIP